MTRIKICGVTLPDDAARIAAAGADYIGLNFWPQSKRYLAPERAPAVIAKAGGLQVVGLFVNAELAAIEAVAAQLDRIQLHGDESPDFVARVAAIRPV